jgi:LysM repeat protein
MDNLDLAGRALKVGGKIKELGLTTYNWIRTADKREKWSNFKGSLKDPLLYLGFISLVLFLGLVSNGFSFCQSQSAAVCQESQSVNKTFMSAGLTVKESPDLSLIQKNSLAAISPPLMVTPQILGALIDSADYQWSEKTVTEYVVEPGDTLTSIAEKFNVSLNTILWANELTKSSTLKLGQTLVILPVSGTLHQVQKGETLGGIANTYKVTSDSIIAYNDLVAQGDIYIGDILIIPGGTQPAKVSTPVLAPLASSYFICPIAAPCRVTQGLHWYNAIDFSHSKCGDAIFAAAEGTVQKVKITSSRSKWAFGGGGNTITILHPNGVVTSYGHVQSSLVSVGDHVSQGQIIALMGGMPGTPGAGMSTGCHLHFGVYGAKNPFAK